MSSSFQVTYVLRSSSHTGVIPLDARVKKCREVRALIADRLSTQEDDLALYCLGSEQPIGLEEDISAFTMLEVVRGLLNVGNSANRTLTATQQRQKRDAKEVRAIVGSSGIVTMHRGGGGGGRGGGGGFGGPGISSSPMAAAQLNTSQHPSASSAEDESIRKMQEQIAQETGVEGFRRPHFLRALPPAADPTQRMREPPKGYICHNCGRSGHHIDHCPEARNGGFNRIKKFQNPVGIPESMLERCDIDDPRPKFVTRDGIIVARKVQANVHETLSLGGALGSDATAGSLQNVPDRLKCGICHEPLVKAVTTPCCTARTCEACLLNRVSSNAGADDDDGPPTCPLCNEPLLIDDVQADEDARKEVSELQRKRARTGQ